MTHLQKNWLTEGTFDFEYKKYTLLAYLQHIDNQFKMNRLHPHLPDLELHRNACLAIRSNKSRIRTSFPKNLTGINPRTWTLEYEELHQDDPYLEELNYILDFSIPRLTRSLESGTERFSEVRENVRISPVGIVPLRLEEGYLLFLHTFQPMVSVFAYQLALYNEMKERYLKTTFLETVRVGIGNSVSQIKVDLTRKNRSLPNPATYIVESKYDYPLHEALLPVAKKLVLKEMNIA
ncbi:hypothetical protein [Dyadobacter sediminis]|uniref:Uncharacterized protein n=1 Tax=Dyadobacter sediminis TaxID=1493691 RepID=A0A5R9KER2_9BACT|nr:hypothetical protein [Dyadobacter sediminis]TLU94531.1 hypothetical protein FEM55_09865 [Dyadobacter sediminis]GGB90419.1 hypothetical protein GCM10011325_17350 [Dyadobacter sediminis]